MSPARPMTKTAALIKKCTFEAKCAIAFGRVGTKAKDEEGRTAYQLENIANYKGCSSRHEMNELFDDKVREQLSEAHDHSHDVKGLAR
jgi:hypothetical protein